MLWFCNFLYLFCNFISLCLSNEDIGECSSSKKNETSCCADYYRDSETKSCLPCVGWFGHNCSTQCQYGFFGHGCRSQCDCNNSQKCDPMIGCIVTNGETSNLTNYSYMEKVYNILTRAHGINICYNSTTESIECCTGFTNRTGVCEKDPENTIGNAECKVSDTLTENLCAEKCGYSNISGLNRMTEIRISKKIPSSVQNHRCILAYNWFPATQKHRTSMPQLTYHQIEQYFLYKMAGKPLAANKIPWKRKHTDEILEDPRKEKYLKYSSGYSSYIYNCMVNY